MQLIKKASKVTAVMISKEGAKSYATFKLHEGERTALFEGKEYAWTGERNASGYLIMKEVT